MIENFREEKSRITARMTMVRAQDWYEICGADGKMLNKEMARGWRRQASFFSIVACRDTSQKTLP